MAQHRQCCMQDAEQGSNPSRRPSWYGPIKKVFKRPSAVHQVSMPWDLLSICRPAQQSACVTSRRAQPAALAHPQTHLTGSHCEAEAEPYTAGTQLKSSQLTYVCSLPRPWSLMTPPSLSRWRRKATACLQLPPGFCRLAPKTLPALLLLSHRVCPQICIRAHGHLLLLWLQTTWHGMAWHGMMHVAEL